MPTCVAYGCTNNTSDEGRDKTLSFHSFPLSDKTLLGEWLDNLKRGKSDDSKKNATNKVTKPWKPTIHSRICSVHFTKECFIKNMYNDLLKLEGRSAKKCKRILKPGAVPTIFVHKKQTAKRRNTENRLENKARREVSTD